MRAWWSMLWLVAGCGGGGEAGLDAAPVHRIENASFEVAGESDALAAGWSRTATAGAGCPTYGGDPAGTRATDTAFMPTQGQFFFSFPGFNYSTALSQDDVDLSGATSLRFDYSVSGTLPGDGARFELEMLFTASGTETLWSRSYDVSTGVVPVERRDESISLPALSTPGRLMIRATVTCATAGTRTLSTNFSIDNLAVE